MTWLALPRATQTIDLANGKKNDKIQACAAQFRCLFFQKYLIHLQKLPKRNEYECFRRTPLKREIYKVQEPQNLKRCPKIHYKVRFIHLN